MSIRYGASLSNPYIEKPKKVTPVPVVEKVPEVQAVPAPAPAPVPAPKVEEKK